MNRRMICYLTGRVLIVEGVLMVLSVIVGLIYKETMTWVFAPAIATAVIFGVLLSFKKPKNTDIYAREGMFVVAASWILMSLIGALPFWFTGQLPTFWDCIFEIVSGFTTTGASILSNPEYLPKCVIFWRSFSHWIGGMGVLVFVLAIIPMSDNRSLHLMRAEVPGPVVGKLVPRMRSTAKILYGTYTAMTAVLVIMLIAGGMPVFDSFCTAFGTAGTGGFSVHSAGIGLYSSAYIEIVLSVFMLLFGINFNLYYFILIGKAKQVFKNEEARVYIFVVIVATLLIGANVMTMYANFGESLRYSFFQVASILTTTGFATADFAGQWPQFSQHILLLLMIMGACAGSTGGGIKISRVIVLIKSFFHDIVSAIHPRGVSVIRMDKKPLEKGMISAVKSYLSIYVIIICVSVLLLSIDGFDLVTNLSAELACFNNIGPGIGSVGPMSNYSAYSGFSKILLALNMLLGRLEIFPILVLFTPQMWKKRV